MAAKKKAKAKKAAPKVIPTFIGDYDWKWIMDNPDHPAYKKVMKEARKKKFI